MAWQQLGIPALNHALASPVTPLELHVQALEDKGVLTTDSAAKLLPPLALDLGAAAAGGRERVFAVRLHNPGALAAAWQLHSYDDPEVGFVALTIGGRGFWAYCLCSRMARGQVGRCSVPCHVSATMR